MFLLYLSDRNYESRYLAFILRLETIVAGVVTEMAKRIETLTDREAADSFADALAHALDVNSGVVPKGWWDNMTVPSIDWYQSYLSNELPLMIREARRIAASKENGAESKTDPFDRLKIMRLAHEDAAFQQFLARDKSK